MTARLAAAKLNLIGRGLRIHLQSATRFFKAMAALGFADSLASKSAAGRAAGPIVARRLTAQERGGDGRPYRILDTSIKMRPCSGFSISSALAAEKVGAVNIHDIKRVTVEEYERALDRAGSGEQRWNPDSRETADHSIPYIVAATLTDGLVSLRSFDDAHLFSPDLRALMKRIEVVENPEFTKSFQGLPSRHCTRITVTTSGGCELVGESGHEQDELGAQKSNSQIEGKFRSLTEEYLGATRVQAILDRLWRIEAIDDVRGVPSEFVLT